MDETKTKGLPHWTVIGFTGHRVLDKPDSVAQSIRSVLDGLTDKYGALATVSSAAAGSDTLFLESTAEYQIPSQVILPFDKQRFAKDFTTEQWQRIEPLINSSIERTIVGTVPGDEEAYLESGMLTVDRCDILVAVWNGKTALGKGGTSEVVDYARSICKPLIIIDSITGQISRERVETIANNEVKPTPLPGQLRGIIAQSYTDLDKIAEDNAPKARALIIWIIFLHLFVSAIAITDVVLHSTEMMELGIGFSKVVILVAALIMVAQHHKVQHRWVDARPVAEFYRFFLAIWPLRREGAPVSAINLRGHQTTFRDLHLAWKIDHNAELPFQEARSHYLSERIKDQLRYYSGALKTAGVYHNLIPLFAMVATWLAIAAGIAVVVMKIQNYSDDGYIWAKLLSIILPMAAVALLTFSISHDLGRRVIRYQEMIVRLEKAERQVQSALTWPGLWRAVDALERDLLAEVDEWQSVASFTGKAH